MKSRTLKLFPLMLAIVLVSSLAVLAAPITTITNTPTVDANGNITVVANISDTSVAQASKQVTMLTYLGTPTDSTIIGVDQLTSDASGNVTFTFNVDSSVTTGDYTILVGGEDVNVAATKTIHVALASATPTATPTPTPTPTQAPGHTISGVVGPLSGMYLDNPGNDPIVTQLFNYFSKAKVELMNVDITTVLKSADIQVTSNPSSLDTLSIPFALTGVADGSYVLALTRKGMCTKLIAVTVSGADVNVGTKVLKGADVYGGVQDYDISFSDVLTVLDIYKSGNTDLGSPHYNADADIDGDGSITFTDVLSCLDAYKVFGPYQEIQ